jgi:type II secretory pathway predicted ATPase ExeA
MYETFYGFRERPFSLLPDPAFLFLSRQHRHALTLLDYALSQGTGFALITGTIGSGKTTLLRHILARNESAVTFGYLTNTRRTMGSMLPWVGRSLGISADNRGEPEMYDAFVAFLMKEYTAGRRVALIVDEAQNLSPEALEELRLLSNLNSERNLMLQTILVGQPELRQTLRKPDLYQVAQRIAIDYHLDKLSRADTREYVRHRLVTAGGSPDIIAADAIDLLHASTDGVPRLINLVCDMALVYGFAEQQRRIDVDLLRQVIRDRSSGGLLALDCDAANV